MVKLKGPAISGHASGKLARALIFSHSKKRSYTKTHAAPANPQTGSQRSVRAAMSFLSKQWAPLNTADRDTWLVLAAPDHIAPYHAFVAGNQQRWKTFRTPTKTYPALELSTPPKAPRTTGVGGIKMATLDIIAEVPTPTWGYFTMRDTSDIAVPSWDLVVAMIPYFSPASHTYWVDQLETGTYYYRTIGFNVDGVQSLRGAQWSVVIA